MIRSFPRITILVLVLAGSALEGAPPLDPALDPALEAPLNPGDLLEDPFGHGGPAAPKPHEPCFPGKTAQVCQRCYFTWLGRGVFEPGVAPYFVVDEDSGGVEHILGSSFKKDAPMLFPGIQARVEPALQLRPHRFQPEELRYTLDELLRRLYFSEYDSICGTWILSNARTVAYSTNSGHGYATGPGGSAVTYSGGGYSSAGYSSSGNYSTSSGYGSGRPAGPSSGRPATTYQPTVTRPARPVTTPPVTSVTPPSRPVSPVPQVSPPVSPQRPSNPPPPPRVRPAEPRRALPPPPPPPAPPKPAPAPPASKGSSGWVWILGALVAVSMLFHGLRNYFRIRRSGENTERRDFDVLGLLDPGDRGARPERIREVASAAALDEDWLKAMRYRFAELLLSLESTRTLELAGWQTNLEIAHGLAAKPRVAESFWATATVFELFFFGKRRPTESDYSMFSMLLEDCLGSLAGEGGAR